MQRKKEETGALQTLLNQSTQPKQPSLAEFRDISSAIIIGIVIFTLTVIFNGWMINSIIYRQKFHVVLHRVVMHLGIAGICFACAEHLGVALWQLTFSWEGGEILCKLFMAFKNFSNVAIVLFVSAVSVDRAKNLSQMCAISRNSKFTNAWIYASWATAALSSIPMVRETFLPSFMKTRTLAFVKNIIITRLFQKPCFTRKIFHL